MILKEKCSECGFSHTSITTSSLFERFVKGERTGLAVETHYCTECLAVFEIKTILYTLRDGAVGTIWVEKE